MWPRRMEGDYISSEEAPESYIQRPVGTSKASPSNIKAYSTELVYTA